MRCSFCVFYLMTITYMVCKDFESSIFKDIQLCFYIYAFTIRTISYDDKICQTSIKVTRNKINLIMLKPLNPSLGKRTKPVMSLKNNLLMTKLRTKIIFSKVPFVASNFVMNAGFNNITEIFIKKYLSKRTKRQYLLRSYKNKLIILVSMKMPKLLAMLMKKKLIMIQQHLRSI